jgi:magnesium transporter
MSSTSRLRGSVPSVRRHQRRAGAPALAAPSANVRVVEHNGLRWLDINPPTSASIDFLRDEFGFHPLALEDVTSRVQRPKLDVYDDFLFLVMHFPVHHKVTRATSASEVDLFVGPDYVVTVHDGQLKALTRMFDAAEESSETRAILLGESSARLLYYVVDRLVEYCFPVIDKLAERVDVIQDTIFQQSGVRMVQEISLVRTDLIALRRIIKPQLGLVAQLEHRDLPLVGDDTEVYFGDVSDHLAKIWDVLEEERDVLEGLSATFDSLVTHRLNEVIKALTIISVVILPLTLITGLYGMNVPLPYEHSGHALVILLAVMLVTVGLMLGAFRMRKWL